MIVIKLIAEMSLKINRLRAQLILSFYDSVAHSHFSPGANPTTLEFTTTTPALWYATYTHTVFFKVEENISVFKTR
jgi:hypothetical protein